MSTMMEEHTDHGGRPNTVNMEQYYQAVSDLVIQQSFSNLDDPATLCSLLQAVQSSSTRNFAVDFTENAACVAFDLPPSSLMTLLDTDRSGKLNTLWINVWYPYHQRPLLEVLAQRYDFSPRLLALMSSDPQGTQRSATSSQNQHHSLRRRHGWSRQARSASGESQAEKGLDELSEHSSISNDNSAFHGNLYRIVDDLWHYTSVDFGSSYVCIGYNSLYGTKQPGDCAGAGILPYCTRVWSWLVLCADNTVISINEDPFPFTERNHDRRQHRILIETRRNLVSVFRSLSKVEESARMVDKPMTLLPIRTRLGDNQDETGVDAAGLLFYYLFENWQNSYILITRKESRYGVELTNLRADMFKSPQLSHIDRLDNIGKELGLLKRHYQSYGRIIDRLTDTPPRCEAVLQTSQVLNTGSRTSFDTVRPILTERENVGLGVSLPEAARVRFKRLKDLIDLYALSEVEEYIKQKDAMIAMNFNLIAIKESVDVERLTRATFLLTKVSILFLPVSLLTTYFSIPLANMDYTLPDYWISFSITLFVSWLALFLLGVFNGQLQTVTFLRGCWQGLEMAWNWLMEAVKHL